MSEKPEKDQVDQTPQADRNKPHDGKGLSEKSVTEHHVEGAEGPTGAEAEEDNNP
jgi:hypothetical protein